jgi:hypothetical protein
MADPTSWFTIESGWDVLDRSGAPIGEVTAVVGDEDADIFDGLRFETTDGEERFVIAERVAEIVEGQVSLDTDLAELEAAAGGEPTDEDVAPLGDEDGTPVGGEDAAPGGVEVTRDRDAEL